MRNLQSKGSARAFNLLEEQKIALLADEVGMGKTIQSLAICAALWNQKPDAKILILVPRDEIAKNWEKEYQTFIRHHYRHNDNVVKTVSGHEPVRKMIYCKNLYSLVHNVQLGWSKLYIGKISSFSSLMAGNKAINRLESLNIKGLKRAKNLSVKPGIEFNNEIISLLRNEIVRHSDNNKPFFDLVIIDEAHYFRRKDSDSLRVNSAREFFGDPLSNDYNPIASKVLLLTATPNHSSSKDIGNIVSYFSSKYDNTPYKNILDKICVRRLRRLSSKGKNKYNYREETESESSFAGNPLSEMFFALYQHELAKEINITKSSKQSGRGVSRMMKYLEGVEFIPFEKETQESKSGEEEIDTENKSISTDYTSGSDGQILLKLSKKFREIFNTDPSHPKYEKLVNDLTIKHNGEKAVVFVRRIPSVYEIAKRIIEYYDRNMWQLMNNGNELSLTYEKLDRKSFNKNLLATDDPIIEEDDKELNNQEEESKIPSSKVLGLFKIMKNDSVRSTDASNFRLRFTHSKPNIFALFFSPGQDYFNSPYINLNSYRYDVAGEKLENFYNSALIHRTRHLNNDSIAKDILSLLLSKNPLSESDDYKKVHLPTLLTIFWDTIINDNLLSEVEKNDLVNTYNSFSIYEKEAFSNYLEKGTLLASESIVIFYNKFRKITESNPENKPLDNYIIFCEEIKNSLHKLKLYNQIKDSILHFKTIYTKVFSINGEKQLLEESWDSFNNAQPIYPYNADNSNQKVLKSFNTPFYPDMLVATSVLQEGVNLQYFCNTIYHYGMAWTPGDNEQRIGRIDRMFGKIERNLEKDSNSKLNIYYPYLKDTIDEEHLSRFIIRKYKEETLIDQGKAFEEGSDFSLEENETGGWKTFLRKPDTHNFNDPFPVNNNHFEDIKIELVKPVKVTLDKFYNSIINSLIELRDFNSEIFYVNQEDNQKILIDPTINNGRKQPVVIELVYDNIGSGIYNEPIYCLKMKTPLCAVSQYKKLKSKFYSNQNIQKTYLPGIKLCLDPSQTGGSVWGIYMSYELPLFLTSLDKNPLSKEEVKIAFNNLIHCADTTEIEIFNKDLKREELNLPENIILKNSNDNFRNSNKKIVVNNWQINGDYYFLTDCMNYSKNQDNEKIGFTTNHENLYLKTLPVGFDWFIEVSYNTIDTQREELNLLEKHLEIFINSKNIN